MGNRLINCCDTPASLRASEFTLNAPSQAAQADVNQPTTSKGHNKLKLEVMSSDALAAGQLLFMDQLGVLDSLRGARDGCTYFGSHKKLRGEVVNDFLIPAEGDRGQHFVIYYNFEAGSFWVKPLTTGFGVLVRREKKFCLSLCSWYACGVRVRCVAKRTVLWGREHFLVGLRSCRRRRRQERRHGGVEARTGCSSSLFTCVWCGHLCARV